MTFQTPRQACETPFSLPLLQTNGLVDKTVCSRPATEKEILPCVYLYKINFKKKINTELAECFNRLKRRQRGGGGGVIGEELRHFIGKSAHLYVSSPLVMEMQMSSAVYFLRRGNDRSTGQKKRKERIFPGDTLSRKYLRKKAVIHENINEMKIYK